ncbi:MAG: F0F1 ATP synthase subunit B [Gemmatimonadales bacterium]
MTTVLLALLETAQEAHGPITPFQVEFGLFFWTWVVFIALFFLLKKFAWPAILKTTEERERTIQRQLDEAQRLHTGAKAALEQQQKLLGESRSQAQGMIAEARTAAERERAVAVEKTRQEQDQLLARARREIAAERERAITDLRREAVDLSLAAAAKLVGQRLDTKADRELVEQFIGSMERGK